jgi:C4-dicarboxylate-binding protein DctP
VTSFRHLSLSALQIAMKSGLLLFAASITSAVSAPEEHQGRDVVVAAVRTAGTPAEEYWKKFSDQYARSGKGSVVFSDIPTVLGRNGSIIEALRNGDIQLTVASDSSIYDLIPEFSILRLPYLVHDELHLEDSFKNCIAPALKPQFSAAGLVLLGPMRSGWLVVYGSQPVEKPSELYGVPYRQSLSPVTNGYLEYLGASLVTVPYPKIHEWLASEAKAFGDFSILELTSMTRNKPAVKAVTMTRHGYFLGAVLANKKWYDSLSRVDQQALRDALPAQEYWQRNVRAYEQAYLDESKDLGIAIGDIHPEDRSSWENSATAFRKEFLKSRGKRWNRLHDCIKEQAHVEESDVVKF